MIVFQIHIFTLEIHLRDNQSICLVWASKKKVQITLMRTLRVDPGFHIKEYEVILDYDWKHLLLQTNTNDLLGVQ
jgi:hypothetical protein